MAVKKPAKFIGGKLGEKGAKVASKKGGGSEGFLVRIPSEPLTVRFMSDPPDWIQYLEHYNDELKYFPCIGKSHGCVGCNSGIKDQIRASKRFLTNAIDVAESKVIPLVLPVTVYKLLYKKYDKYSTLIDRDYELSKEGDGINTEYDVDPGDKTTVKLSRYDELDLEKLLQDQLDKGSAEEDDDEDFDDDEEDDEPPARKRTGTKGRLTAKKNTGTSIRNRRHPSDVLLDDEDDEEDDTPPVRSSGSSLRKGKPEPTGKKILKKPSPKLKKLTKK